MSKHTFPAHFPLQHTIISRGCVLSPMYTCIIIYTLKTTAFLSTDACIYAASEKWELGTCYNAALWPQNKLSLLNGKREKYYYRNEKPLLSSLPYSPYYVSMKTFPRKRTHKLPTTTTSGGDEAGWLCVCALHIMRLPKHNPFFTGTTHHRHNYKFPLSPGFFFYHSLILFPIQFA